ncbi:MAG: HupE/UreJ family protein [Ferruginibacter sp.]
MSDFIIYFKTGWEHIISPGALDHLLFIAALTAVYLAKDWKQLLILVTAFTIGHSLTLALSVYDLLRLKDEWVEFLIPLTIVLTALFNFFLKGLNSKSLRVNYFLALFFGLVHGMGFANTIRFMLSKSQDILVPLLSFNIGLEVGQIAAVTVLLFTGYLLVNKAGLAQKYWVLGLSALALIAGAQICVERWPF